MQIRVRRIYPEDFHRLAEIQVRSLPQDPISLLGTNALTSSVYPGLLQSDVGSSIIELDDQVVGFAFLTASTRSQHIPLWQELPSVVRVLVSEPLLVLSSLVGKMSSIGLTYDAELSLVCVEPTHQRRGLGRILVESIVRTYQLGTPNQVAVRTLKSTPHNVQFYRSLGFCLVREKFGRVWLTLGNNEHSELQE